MTRDLFFIPKKRKSTFSVIACKRCHEDKKKCIQEVDGEPCTRCAEKGFECISRKQLRRGRKKIKSSNDVHINILEGSNDILDYGHAIEEQHLSSKEFQWNLQPTNQKNNLEHRTQSHIGENESRAFEYNNYTKQSDINAYMNNIFTSNLDTMNTSLHQGLHTLNDNLRVESGLHDTTSFPNALSQSNSASHMRQYNSNNYFQQKMSQSHLIPPQNRTVSNWNDIGRDESQQVPQNVLESGANRSNWKNLNNLGSRADIISNSKNVEDLTLINERNLRQIASNRVSNVESLFNQINVKDQPNVPIVPNQNLNLNSVIPEDTKNGDNPFTKFNMVNNFPSLDRPSNLSHGYAGNEIGSTSANSLNLQGINKYPSGFPNSLPLDRSQKRISSRYLEEFNGTQTRETEQRNQTEREITKVLGLNNENIAQVQQPPTSLPKEAITHVDSSQSSKSSESVTQSVSDTTKNLLNNLNPLFNEGTLPMNILYNNVIPYEQPSNPLICDKFSSSIPFEHNLDSITSQRINFLRQKIAEIQSQMRMQQQLLNSLADELVLLLHYSKSPQ